MDSADILHIQIVAGALPAVEGHSWDSSLVPTLRQLLLTQHQPLPV